MYINNIMILIITESLEEHKIRDLNDKINKLFREKWHWNRRVRELGGPDYRVRRMDIMKPLFCVV